MLNETTSEDELDDARRRGQLWVALAGDAPVGFAHVKVLEPTAAHLEEIDVHPDHTRRGIGTRLIAAILAWAADAGYRAVTLTTFRGCTCGTCVIMHGVDSQSYRPKSSARLCVPLSKTKPVVAWTRGAGSSCAVCLDLDRSSLVSR